MKIACGLWSTSNGPNFQNLCRVILICLDQQVMPRIPLFLVLPQGMEVIFPNQDNRCFLTGERHGRISILTLFPLASLVSVGRGEGSGAQEDREVSWTRLLFGTGSFSQFFPPIPLIVILFSFLLVHILPLSAMFCIQEVLNCYFTWITHQLFIYLLRMLVKVVLFLSTLWVYLDSCKSRTSLSNIVKYKAWTLSVESVYLYGSKRVDWRWHAILLRCFSITQSRF